MKKGLSNVVVAVIIILVAIAAIAIVWSFLSPTLKGVGTQVSTQKLTTNLEVPEQEFVVDYVNGRVTFSVERKVGQGSVTGIIAILVGQTGNTKRYDGVSDSTLNTPINELEKKSFTLSFGASDFSELGNPIVEISVAPILRNSDGTTLIGNVVTTRRHSGGGSNGGNNPTPPIPPACGALNQQCCASSQCNSGLTCSSGNVCLTICNGPNCGVGSGGEESGGSGL